MLRALLLALLLLLTVSCTAADDLAGQRVQSESDQPTSPSSSAAEQNTEPGSPTSTPTRSSTPSPKLAPPPQAGTCRMLRRRDLQSVVNDARVVPCAQRHTSVTYHVGRLPAAAVAGAASAGEEKVEKAASEVCSRRFDAYVGGTAEDRSLTSLRRTYFLPETEQFRAGARWVRCDLFAYAANTHLADLPGRLEGALDDARTRARMGICSKVSPDRPRFQHIICAREHSWRAVSRVQLGDDRRFPGEGALSRRASSRCQDVVRDYLDTREAFSYGFEVPQRTSWERGNRLGYCWAQTSD